MLFILSSLLFTKVRIRIIKNRSIKIVVTLFGLKIQINRGSGETNKESTVKRNQKPLSYIHALQCISKWLKYCDIIIEKIVFPNHGVDLSVESFLRPYKEEALAYTLLSYIASHAKYLSISENAIEHSRENSTLCLDFSFEFKLFFGFLFLFDYIRLTQKTIKNRR